MQVTNILTPRVLTFKMVRIEGICLLEPAGWEGVGAGTQGRVAPISQEALGKQQLTCSSHLLGFSLRGTST